MSRSHVIRLREGLPDSLQTARFRGPSAPSLGKNSEKVLSLVSAHSGEELLQPAPRIPKGLHTVRHGAPWKTLTHLLTFLFQRTKFRKTAPLIGNCVG